MVLMLGVMKVLEVRGVLTWIAKIVARPLKVIGIPALGVFAALQILLVSFAAPVATFVTIEKQASRREIAATLAMVLAMTQANSTFPLLAVGLDLWRTLLFAIVGGAAAAFITYYVFARPIRDDATGFRPKAFPMADPTRSAFGALLDGGHEAVQIVVRSIPILVITLLCVDIMKSAGLFSFLESALSPLLGRIGLPGTTLVPIATKYTAGGTAMTGVVLKMVQDGTLSAAELNRLAGLIINPLDPVELAVLAAAGPRTASCIRAAVCGAAFGILIRTVLHLSFF
jgi:spore maturation protein SpmB